MERRENGWITEKHENEAKKRQKFMENLRRTRFLEITKIAERTGTLEKRQDQAKLQEGVGAPCTANLSIMLKSSKSNGWPVGNLQFERAMT